MATSSIDEKFAVHAINASSALLWALCTLYQHFVILRDGRPDPIELQV